MIVRLLAILGLSAALAGSAACSQTGSGAAAGSVQQRRTVLLRGEVAAPFPSPVCGGGNPNCINGQLTQALAMLSLGDRASAAAANAEIAQAVDGMAGDVQAAARLSAQEADDAPSETARSFHFVRAGLLHRMMRTYGPAPFGGDGTLTAPVAESILRSFQLWSAGNCRVADADGTVWRIWKSENHDVQRTGACWAAADLMRRVPRYAATAYPDGSRPAEQYARWSQYVVRYLGERTHHGTLEYFSPTYTAYSLSPVYGWADLSDDPGLRQAARAYLDQWWTQWAQESVRGCYGASANRAYPKEVRLCAMGPVAWMYFGQGEQGRDAPGIAAALSSGYLPPRLAVELVGDPARRGSYEVFARSPGLLGDGGSRSSLSAAPAILRIGYVTPTFVVGTPVVARLPSTAWNLGAVQNQRAVVTMAGRDQLIAFEPAAAGRGSAYNGLWGLQSRGTQVLALAPPSFSRNVQTLRMFVGSGLTATTRGGWTFFEGAAWCAVKPLVGGMHPDPGDAGWQLFDSPNEPIVVQGAELLTLAPSLAAFQDAVLKMPISGGGGQVTVQGLDGADRIEFSTDPRRLGQVGGRIIDPRAAGPALVGPFARVAG